MENEKIEEKIEQLNNELFSTNNKIESKDILCREAKQCVEKGYISIDDDVEFKTIRDVTDLFNKHYTGFQRSWIKVDSDWKRIAACYQMSSMSDRNIYKNIFTSDGNCFYYLIDEKNDEKKKEAVEGIINHEMEITFLFLKYPNSIGYKFVGIFKKDNEAMQKSIEDKEYRVVYKKIDNKLDLTQFFN